MFEKTDLSGSSTLSSFSKKPPFAAVLLRVCMCEFGHHQQHSTTKTFDAMLEHNGSHQAFVKAIGFVK
jgi:hypothetical protein